MAQVTLTLNGRSYRVGCGDGEEARLDELGVHVREKMDTVVRDFGQVGEARVLLLAALLITDELYDARAERDTAASTSAAAAALREVASLAKSETKVAVTPVVEKPAEKPLEAATPATPPVPKPDDPAKLEDKPALSSLQAAMNRQAPVVPHPDSTRKAG